MDGRYDYRDHADYDVLFATPGAPQDASRDRIISVAPSGDQFGAYASVRAQPMESVVLDLGLRWDHQTLSDDGADALSPRASVLWLLGDRTRVRAAWGRYFQAQAINELQVPDGVDEFLPPQRADHWVAGIEYQHPAEIDLRLEVYRKEYDAAATSLREPAECRGAASGAEAGPRTDCTRVRGSARSRVEREPRDRGAAPLVAHVLMGVGS